MRLPPLTTSPTRHLPRPSPTLARLSSSNARSPKRIDEAAVEEARRRAEERLREQLSDEELAAVNSSLARSLAQLNVKRRPRL